MSFQSKFYSFIFCKHFNTLHSNIRLENKLHYTICDRSWSCLMDFGKANQLKMQYILHRAQHNNHLKPNIFHKGSQVWFSLLRLWIIHCRSWALTKASMWSVKGSMWSVVSLSLTIIYIGRAVKRFEYSQALKSSWIELDVVESLKDYVDQKPAIEIIATKQSLGMLLILA